ncbi:MAG: helicase-exonuclease AddAB subunit AddA [Clostridia bacterium]|nr:helicase-exonuclease AddAB subunit AddA [Clostridia bacterium]
MSEMTFTPAQQDAIDAFGGSVIVSAAAGSGKTRVLVQRVISLLTDPDRPIDADRLLIVTFTRAAADEMRGRIADAIEKKLFYEPNNSLLRRQQVLIANADICTIHSFCSRIIRENFYLLDIDQDFRIATEGESSILRHRLLSQMIEERLASREEGFLSLAELLSSSRSDKNMEKTLLDVYESASSHPFPDMWLDTVTGFYDPSIPLENTRYAMVALDRLNSAIEDMNSMLSEARDVIENNPAFCSSAATAGIQKLQALTSFLSGLKEAAECQDWDMISACVNGFQKTSYTRPRSKKSVTVEECNIVKNAFDFIDSTVMKELTPIFGIDRDSYRESTGQLFPAVLAMCSLLKDFDRRLFQEKKERGILDFSDLEHLMLRLLMDITDNGPERSAFARTLSTQYDQIMVDEYQDTNETQETIFRCLSNNENNLFVVGDIKQSIYRFREAMPEIFKRRRSKSTLYDRESPSFPAKIILDRNFRSREGIIDSVNFIFHTIMSEKVGEIEYNDEEKLTAGASYPETDDTSMELHLMDIESGDEDEEEDDDVEENLYQREAGYIASLIKEKISSGMLVKDGDRQRPVTYGDFAILTRFIKSHGQEYADVLNACGIPAYIDKPYSLFGCYEVNILISLLKAVDNPLQDIPMLALLVSPVFGFTADDLADLKSGYQGRMLYNKLCRCLEDESGENAGLKAKCLYFSEIYSKLRKLSVTVSPGRLLDSFFEMTGYTSIMSAAQNGAIRIRNICKLAGFINDYENGGRNSLSDLVRHINYLEENGTEITADDTAPVNSVRIMTVHHSKGLEFPVCILAAMNSKGSPDTEEVICHADLGFGMKKLDRSDLTRYNTLQRNVITAFRSGEEISEAMRVFYVALTRAKEKLIAVVSYPKLSKDSVSNKLKALSSAINIHDGRISPITVGSTSSLADWMIMCALVHPDMAALRQDAGRSELLTIPTASRWEYHRITEIPSEEVTDRDDLSSAEYDAELRSLLERRAGYEYRYRQRTGILSKVSASTLVHNDMLDYHIAVSRPAFMQEDKLTGAERGTAVHAFLQHAELVGLENDPQAELERLKNEGFLTAQQAAAVSKRDIDGFLSSGIYSSMKGSVRLLREHRFTVNIPASDIDPEYPAEENVILQGAIDCMIFDPDGIIIVDYKTDRVKSVSELKDRYARQLQLYKKAADQLFDIPVKKCCIYSIHLAEETDIPLE